MNLNQFSPGAFFFDSESWNPNKIDVENIPDSKNNTFVSPMYNVVLIDDNDHTYEYVIEMLMKIFGHDRERAFLMALTVDYIGKVVVFTGEKEVAENKKNEITSYGPDWRLTRSTGSMLAVVEQVG
jgi:ATP-dependent Clp protease adaptor protein ClpS